MLGGTICFTTRLIRRRLIDVRPPRRPRPAAGVALEIFCDQLILEGEWVPFGRPEEMAGYAVEMRDLGFTVIGACCGSTPAHIAAMREALA